MDCAVCETRSSVGFCVDCWAEREARHGRWTATSFEELHQEEDEAAKRGGGEKEADDLSVLSVGAFKSRLARHGREVAPTLCGCGDKLGLDKTPEWG